MKSWRTLTLVFCVFVCRLYLTEAHCADHFNPDNWSKSFSKITVKNFTRVVPLVDADSFEDMVKCTLGNEITKGNGGEVFLEDCMNYNNKIVPRASVSPCRQEFKRVSFFDLMCLVANASDSAAHVCSRDSQTDVVEEMYSKFHKTPTTTTLPTTTEPSTTTKLTTATAKSTTVDKTTENSPTPTTSWSISSSASSTASQPSTGNASWNQPLQLTQEVAYPLLAWLVFSGLMNLVLVFCVALLCSHRRSRHRAYAESNGYSLGNLDADTNRPLRAEDVSTAHSSDDSNV